jgi:hypothetical protein
VPINYLRNIYRVPADDDAVLSTPVHYSTARKTSMNFDVARLRAREDDATEMEERVTRASLFFRERNRVERSSLRESARFGIDHDDERQRWSYRKRREEER